ncbi:MAG: hypothetical protein QM681_03255 [Novosphingobium sp.]
MLIDMEVARNSSAPHKIAKGGCWQSTPKLAFLLATLVCRQTIVLLRALSRHLIAAMSVLKAAAGYGWQFSRT